MVRRPLHIHRMFLDFLRDLALAGAQKETQVAYIATRNAAARAAHNREDVPNGDHFGKASQLGPGLRNSGAGAFSDRWGRWPRSGQADGLCDCPKPHRSVLDHPAEWSKPGWTGLRREC